MKCPDCGDWVDCRDIGAYPDKMPQAIKLIDAEGVPAFMFDHPGGRVVDSEGHALDMLDY